MHKFETELLRSVVESSSYDALLAVLARAHTAVPCSDEFMRQLVIEVRLARARIYDVHLVVMEGKRVA